jgi:UDP-glucuronate 4-epimerase
MRKYLVTGGAGFIGSHLSAQLLNEGSEVTVLDNFDPFYSRGLKRSNLENLIGREGFRLIEGDINDESTLSGLLGTEFHAIVHLAAKAGVRPSIANPLSYQHVNVAGTQTLLEFARKCGVPQFVFASSSSVYGVNPNVPWREDDCVLRPISPYAATKVTGELLGHVYAHLYGIRFVALRFFTVYGPRQRPDLAIRKYAELLLAGRSLPVFGDGTTSRDYTYVDDVVAGIRAAIHYDGAAYEVVNLGNEKPINVLDMIRTLEDTLEIRARLDFLPPQPGDVPRTWAGIAKARRLFGYEPRTPFVEGIGRFAAWIRENNSPI